MNFVSRMDLSDVYIYHLVFRVKRPRSLTGC